MELRLQVIVLILLKSMMLIYANNYSQAINSPIPKTNMLAYVCSEEILKKFNLSPEDIYRKFNASSEDDKKRQIYVDSLTGGWSENFLSCGHIELNNNEFCAIDNSTIYVEKYQTSYNATDYYSNGDVIYVCASEKILQQLNVSSSDEKFKIITIVGISLSNICLGLHILAFICISEMRNLSGKNLFSLTLAVFFSFTFFIISSIIDDKIKMSCIIFSILTYYFFVSSFLWMSIIGFEIWRSLKMLRYETGFYAKNKEFQRYLQYSIFGWVTPVLLISIILILDNVPGVKKQHRPDLGKTRCWFSSNNDSLFIFFLAPLIIVMVSNLVFFIWSSYIICHTDKMSKDKRFKVLMKRCASYFRLFVVTGLTWITGIIHFAINVEATVWIFVIFTSFYGIFIFVSFTLTNKVFRKLRNAFPFLEKWLPVTSTSETVESKT